MPPASKRTLAQTTTTSTTECLNELEDFQNEIRRINDMSEGIDDDDDDNDEYLSTSTIKIERDFNPKGLVEFAEPLIVPRKRQRHSIPTASTTDESDSLKKYIRDQIRLSERRVHERFDRLERKINRILEKQFHEETIPSDDVQEEHLIDWNGEQNENPHVDPSELDDDIFPISDEETFEWFCEKLKDEEYLTALILRRWQLARNVSTKSFNVSVKDFLRMHFELPVCCKYSVSGYGAHGLRKKKLEAASISRYVFECFNRTQPGIHSLQDIAKAVGYFWGRAPDTYAKITARNINASLGTLSMPLT